MFILLEFQFRVERFHLFEAKSGLFKEMTFVELLIKSNSTEVMLMCCRIFSSDKKKSYLH